MAIDLVRQAALDLSPPQIHRLHAKTFAPPRSKPAKDLARRQDLTPQIHRASTRILVVARFRSCARQDPNRKPLVFFSFWGKGG